MRIRHVDSIDHLIRADHQVIAEEYLSVVSAEIHEFRGEAERQRYGALVRV